MTEQEYIDLSDKRSLESAISHLENIVPENSSTIDREDLTHVLELLYEFKYLVGEFVKIEHEES